MRILTAAFIVLVPTIFRVVLLFLTLLATYFASWLGNAADAYFGTATNVELPPAAGMSVQLVILLVLGIPGLAYLFATVGFWTNLVLEVRDNVRFHHSSKDYVTWEVYGEGPSKHTYIRHGHPWYFTWTTESDFRWMAAISVIIGTFLYAILWRPVDGFEGISIWDQQFDLLYLVVAFPLLAMIFTQITETLREIDFEFKREGWYTNAPNSSTSKLA